MSFKALLQAALAEQRLVIDDTALKQLVLYLDCLRRWNRVFNLTAIKDPKEMVVRHIIDSLLIVPYLKGKTGLDVGSGAGLPGIPLAILNPTMAWTLLDKNGKKTRFLTQVIAECGLKQVTAVQARLQDYTTTHAGHSFDVITSRAFSTLLQFADEALPLLSETGILLAMKGHYPKEELQALASRHLKIEVHELKMTSASLTRHVVVMALCSQYPHIPNAFL